MTKTSLTSGIFGVRVLQLSMGAGRLDTGSTHAALTPTKFRSNMYFKPTHFKNDTGRSVEFKEKPK